jgi:hypothetical protein
MAPCEAPGNWTYSLGNLAFDQFAIAALISYKVNHIYTVSNLQDPGDPAAG